MYEIHCLCGRAKECVTMVQPLAAERSPPEAWVCKKQRSKRLVAQARKPATKRPARSIGKYCVGENERFAIAEQGNFAYPGELVACDAQSDSFVERRFGKALFKQFDGKSAFSLQVRC